MLDYRLLEALAMVCREGGFDRAARVLNITQSAVSQRVRQLEERLGMPLIVRENPPRPTIVGSRLVAHYLKVAQLEADLGDSIAGEGPKTFLPLPIGVNEDSMATWFIEAIGRLAVEKKYLLHASVDDQEETHKLLKNGDVIGCISTRTEPMQGCRVVYLGRIDYTCVATPDFAFEWFPWGVTEEAVAEAPAVVYSTKDRGHNIYLEEVLGFPRIIFPHHYIPSSHGFINAIASGMGYGLLPHLQSEELLEEGRVIDLTPGKEMHIHLNWHHWDLDSGPIRELTAAIRDYSRDMFPQRDEAR